MNKSRQFDEIMNKLGELYDPDFEKQTPIWYIRAFKHYCQTKE